MVEILKFVKKKKSILINTIRNKEHTRNMLEKLVIDDICVFTQVKYSSLQHINLLKGTYRLCTIIVNMEKLKFTQPKRVYCATLHQIPLTLF